MTVSAPQKSPAAHDRILPPPALLRHKQALFLDVDGSLLELAPSPFEVVIPPGLVTLLRELAVQLDDAVAVVSGRSLIVMDQLLAPWRPSGAGVHGAEVRFPRSHVVRRKTPIPAGIAQGLRKQFALVTEVLIEDKASAVAIHFARCPERAEDCERALLEAIRGLDGLRVQRGRAVVEVVHADANKGGAVRVLMEHEPFAGRNPVFVGDDRTDEAAFAFMCSAGGTGIKVGDGATQAGRRLRDPAAVKRWLADSLAALIAERGAVVSELPRKQRVRNEA